MFRGGRGGNGGGAGVGVEVRREEEGEISEHDEFMRRLLRIVNPDWRVATEATMRNLSQEQLLDNVRAGLQTYPEDEPRISQQLLELCFADNNALFCENMSEEFNLAFPFERNVILRGGLPQYAIEMSFDTNCCLGLLVAIFSTSVF